MDRRSFLQKALLSGLGMTVASRLAEAVPTAKARHLIILWMQGGPSQLDTFDPKAGVDTAGPFKAISTTASGVRISELLPRLAKQMRHVGLVRSMTSAEGNHRRASHLALTGHVPGGVRYPTIGSVASAILAKEGPLPSFVSIGQRQLSGGFLGAAHAPFNVRNPGRVHEMMVSAVRDERRLERRLAMLDVLDESIRARIPNLAMDHQSVRAKAVSLMRAEEKAAFDVMADSEKRRSAYGDSRFGRGVLVARRLIDHGVRVVQVEQVGWDTHVDNFERTKALCADLDRAMGALIEDLAASGKLHETLVVWMGEFGRTPRINENRGRDHFPRAFSVALAGGGIQGGRVVGATSRTGEEILDRPVRTPELLATIYHCLGVPLDRRLGAPRGRPVDVVPDGATPISELL